MDFTSITNNPLYGPLRTLVSMFIGIAITKGWIPANVASPEFIGAVTVGLLIAWSIYQSLRAGQKSDLVAQVAVQKTVALQTPVATSLSVAIQKATVAAAKAVVAGGDAKAITAALNEGQLP